MYYQKCPVCDGTGLVSKPPGIAGDQDTWVSSSAGPYPCCVCGGRGIILIISQPVVEADAEKPCGTNYDCHYRKAIIHDSRCPKFRTA